MNSNKSDPEFSDGTNNNDGGNFDSPVANQNPRIALPNNGNVQEENVIALSIGCRQNDNHDENPSLNQPGGIRNQNNLTNGIGVSNRLNNNITPGTLNAMMPREAPVILFPLGEDEEIVIIENYFAPPAPNQ